MEAEFDPQADAAACYEVAIAAKRAKYLMEQCPAAKRVEVIGDCTLYLGDAVAIADTIGEVGTLMSDPPYGMSFQSNYRGTKHKAIANDGNVELLQWACNFPALH